MSYIGRTPEVGNYRKADSISVVNGQATYNLTVNGEAVNPNANQVICSLNGVVQSSNDSFSIASNQITFASNLQTGDVIDFILILGDTLDVGTPSDNTVGITQLNVSDGTNGQALTTNGSGTLSFSTVSADADNYFATSGLSSKDLGTGLHIKTADSGASANVNADELVIEGSANSGMNILSGNTSAGRIYFGDSSDDDIGQIRYNHDDNSMNFKVNALADALKIDSSGHLIVNGTAGITGTSLMVYNDTTESTAQFVNKATTGNHRGIDFTDGDDTLLGSINFNCGGNTVSYETSSDYRLKENVTDLTGAITRVKNLKPKRFNFKTKPDETLDGFLAHEVQSVIPEAASGTKDETETRKNVVVNAKGNVKACDITKAEWIEGKSNGVFANNTEWFASKEFIRPQGVDQAKLVPLLTSALQEAITKIETLEAKVEALENA